MKPKYRQSREEGLNILGSMLGGLSGKVVKEKKKRKKQLKGGAGSGVGRKQKAGY